MQFHIFIYDITLLWNLSAVIFIYTVSSFSKSVEVSGKKLQIFSYLEFFFFSKKP